MVLACLEQLVISQARLSSWSMIPFFINNEIMFIASEGASFDEISLRNKNHGNTG